MAPKGKLTKDVCRDLGLARVQLQVLLQAFEIKPRKIRHEGRLYNIFTDAQVERLRDAMAAGRPKRKAKEGN